jgi:hypothetical protein
MKRSRAVDIPLVMRVAAAAVLLGCGADHRLEAQRCVTRDWEVVPDANCEAQPTTPGRVPIGSSYFWYYGGRGIGIGERASGGSAIPPSSGVVTRPNSGGYAIAAPGGVSTRGGFGSHASGPHASFGS